MFPLNLFKSPALRWHLFRDVCMVSLQKTWERNGKWDHYYIISYISLNIITTTINMYIYLILYYTILYYTILYYPMLYYIIFYYITYPLLNNLSKWGWKSPFCQCGLIRCHGVLPSVGSVGYGSFLGFNNIERMNIICIYIYIIDYSIYIIYILYTYV